MEVNDLWVYKMIGDIGTKFTGYRHVSTFHDFQITAQRSDDRRLRRLALRPDGRFHVYN